MRKLVTVVALLLAASAFAEELTVDKILAAYTFGAPPERIVEKINDPANTVVPLATEDLARLRAAGVPETVVQALVARAPQPTPTPTAVTPDDARLTTLVQAIKNGVSETVVTEQIRSSGEAYSLSLNDLIFLKQSGVPESIVGALQATAAGATTAKTKASHPAAGATGRAPRDETIEGLLWVKSTFLRKNRQGTLGFKGDEIVWTDAADSVESFSVKASALERAWLKCRPLPAGNFCYELGFSMFKGDDYSFLDSGEPQGSNANVLSLREAIAARFPNLVFEEKIKK